MVNPVLIERDTMTSIGNAIRNKGGATTPLAPGQMPAAINNISGGSDAKLKTVRFTNNSMSSDVGSSTEYGGIIFNVNIYDYINDPNQIVSIYYHTGKAGAGYSGEFPVWMVGFWDTTMWKPVDITTNPFISGYFRKSSSDTYYQYNGKYFPCVTGGILSASSFKSLYAANLVIPPVTTSVSGGAWSMCIKDDGKLVVGIMSCSGDDGTLYGWGRTYSYSGNPYNANYGYISITYKEA